MLPNRWRYLNSHLFRCNEASIVSTLSAKRFKCLKERTRGTDHTTSARLVDEGCEHIACSASFNVRQKFPYSRTFSIFHFNFSITLLPHVRHRSPHPRLRNDLPYRLLRSPQHAHHGVARDARHLRRRVLRQEDAVPRNSGEVSGIP